MFHKSNMNTKEKEHDSKTGIHTTSFLCQNSKNIYLRLCYMPHMKLCSYNHMCRRFSKTKKRKRKKEQRTVSLLFINLTIDIMRNICVWRLPYLELASWTRRENMQCRLKSLVCNVQLSRCQLSTNQLLRTEFLQVRKQCNDTGANIYTIFTARGFLRKDTLNVAKQYSCNRRRCPTKFPPWNNPSCKQRSPNLAYKTHMKADNTKFT